MRIISLLIVLAFGFATPAAAAIQAQLVASVPNLVGIEHPPADPRLFLVDQAGRILIYNGTSVLATPFLDIRSRVTFSGERGLLGLAFHPSYSTNGFFYVNYISPVAPVHTVIARYHVSADPYVAEPNSEVILLTVNQPNTNHNGGQVQFGPDGFLYLSLGEGGVETNAQALNTFLGKLLRIDVNSGSPYGIPPGNPFVSTPGALPEIWAYGLRNPWRFTFDRQTGDLFVADVGQNSWEEVDFQPAGSGGRNYGWRLMEGLHCYNPATNCNPGTPVLTLPILEYSHSLGCSITGGFRYRGALLAGHVGTYFFADYCSGRIWGANPGGRWKATQLLDNAFNVPTLGEDVNGEIFVSSGSALYRLVPGATTPVLTVSKTGTGTGRITSSPAMIECGSICGAQLASGTVVTLTATPDAGTSFSGWSGDADCADGVVTLSADRNCFATFGASVFTDEPIVAGTTVLKAVHITELRSRIGALRAGAGLAPFPWTDPTLTTGTTLIQAIHVTEMRTALNQVYTSAARPLPSYTDPALGAGGLIRAVHISELRSAALILE